MIRVGRVAVWVLAACVLAACDFNINGIDRHTDVFASESFSFMVPAPDQPDVRIVGINGEIRVRGEEGLNAVVIEGIKRVGSDTRGDAERWLERIDVRVSDLPNEVRIVTEHPLDADGRQVTVDYNVRVPIDMNVRIAHTNGLIEVETLDADVTVGHTNGEVAIVDVFGSAEVALVNGQVGAEILLPLNGIVDVRLTNGDIDLALPRDVSAELSASVTNGSVTVSELDLKNSTVGARSVAATLGSGEGLVDLQTVNGAIRVSGF